MGELFKLIGFEIKKLENDIPVTVGDVVFVKHGRLVFCFDSKSSTVEMVTSNNVCIEINQAGEIVDDYSLPLTGYVADVVMTHDKSEYFCIVKNSPRMEPACIGDTTCTGWLIEGLDDTSVTISKDSVSHKLPFETTHSSFFYTYGLCYNINYK